MINPKYLYEENREISLTRLKNPINVDEVFYKLDMFRKENGNYLGKLMMAYLSILITIIVVFGGSAGSFYLIIILISEFLKSHNLIYIIFSILPLTISFAGIYLYGIPTLFCAFKLSLFSSILASNTQILDFLTQNGYFVIGTVVHFERYDNYSIVTYRYETKRVYRRSQFYTYSSVKLNAGDAVMVLFFAEFSILL